eukprot:g3799.t1
MTLLNGNAALFMLSIKNNDRETFDELLEDEINPKEIRDVNGHTPLLFAVLHKRLAMANALLKYGCDPNARVIDSIGGFSSLHIAAEKGFHQLATLLLSRNHARWANVNIRSTSGETPLHCAARCATPGGIIIAEMLISHKIDVNAVDNNGMNASFWAKEFGNTSFLSLEGVPPVSGGLNGRKRADMCRKLVEATKASAGLKKGKKGKKGKGKKKGKKRR